MPIKSLQNIIRVENELYAIEQAEQKKIEEWLLVEEKKITAEYQGKSGALEGRDDVIKKQARKEAEEKAAAIVRTAENQASLLAGVDDDILAPVARKHLSSILSGNFS